MKNGYFVFINRLGQVARTFRWKSDTMVVVLRADNGRMETLESTQELESEGIEFVLLGTFKVADIMKKAVEIEGLGSIEYNHEIRQLSPSPHASPAPETDLKGILRWTAVAALILVSLTIAVDYFLRPEEKQEETIVRVIEQTPEPKKKKEKITVEVSEKKLEPTKKKVTERKKKKTTKVAKVVQPKRQLKPKRMAERHIPSVGGGGNKLGKLGALGVLGAPNSNSNRAGGFDVRNTKNRRASGAGGATVTAGSAKTFLGQGLVAASPGTGDKAQLVGGYGTRGKAGGRSGYGEINIVGSGGGNGNGKGVGGAFSAPMDDEAMVEGGLDRDQIAAVIRRNIGQVRFCYEKGLQTEPGMAGRVAVKFVIGGNGSVNVASVANTSLRDSKVENCIVNRLRTWRFPTPVGNVNVRVTYPFVLSRVSQG